MKKWLTACLLLETLCVTYLLKWPAAIPFTSILYTLCGIAISILILIAEQKQVHTVTTTLFFRRVHIYRCVMLLLIGVATVYFTDRWITGTPLSYKDADMLPIMEVMGKRFMAGNWKTVYQPIPEIWNGIQPIYLPGMWMPFLIAIKAGFDLRWITSTGIFLSFAMCIILWRPHYKKASGFILFLVMGVFFWWLYTENSHNLIRLSEEGIVIFYYSLLTVTLFSRRFFLAGIVAGLCLLSRYTLAGWFPAMLLYFLVMHKQKRNGFRFLLGVAIILVLLAILPFGLEPFRIALHLPGEYTTHAARVWEQNPEYYSMSMGFAKFFGPTHIREQHAVLMICALLAPVLFMAGCLAYQARMKKQLRYIPVACLKFTVVLVYSFIDVPYQYLFYTSSFISLLAVMIVSADRSVPG
jgi:hypothetical protein